MSDYSDSGFDSFLSRSIDNLQQVNLDSQGPYSTATAYDRSQLSGSMGDKFNMGGIGMSAKDSTMTLNNGALIVNDTDTSNTINASSGNIAYFDNTGSLVVQEGLLPDNTTGIRIIDRQGIGLAQFGRFPDGSTALKVAKPGIDVSVARNEDLIFNSSQDIFKIISSGTLNIAGHTLNTGAGNYGSNQSTTTASHNLGIVPAILAFYSSDGSTYSLMPFLTDGGDTTSYYLSWLNVTIDNTTVYGFLNSKGFNRNQPISAVSVKYFLLQETAN